MPAKEITADDGHDSRKGIMMNQKQVRFLFMMSLLELIVLYGWVMCAYMLKGDVPPAAGIVGLVLMACSFTGSVYGKFEMKAFKENHNHMGIVGTRLHMIIFLVLLAIYTAGLVL